MDHGQDMRVNHTTFVLYGAENVHRRLHGSLGMVSPEEFEADYYEALNRELLPA